MQYSTKDDIKLTVFVATSLTALFGIGAYLTYKAGGVTVGEVAVQTLKHIGIPIGVGFIMLMLLGGFYYLLSVREKRIRERAKNKDTEE